MPLRRFQARGLAPTISPYGQWPVLRRHLAVPACRTAALGRIKRGLHQGGDAAKTELPADKGRDRDLVGGIEDRGRRAAGLERPAAERQRREPDRVGRLEGQAVAILARSSRGAGPSIRSGQARQWAIGMRISGEPSCATTEPSRYSTMPWTIDCGCTSTSSSAGADGEQVMRLDHLQALVHHGRGIDRDLRRPSTSSDA